MTSIVDQATVPLLPTKDTLKRMDHFSNTIYKKDQSSVLYRFIDAIVGDAGVGTLKKQLLISRISQSLDTTYFSDLDKIFGNLGGINRQTSEQYGINLATGNNINPSLDLLTISQWDQIRIKDSWYRARIKSFFCALALGGTPDGLRMMVRAAIGVDADIYEMWKFQDHYSEIFGISNMETVTNLSISPSFEYGLGYWVGSYASGGSLTVDNSFVSADAGDGGFYAARLISGTSSTAFICSALCPISSTIQGNTSFIGLPVLQTGNTYNASLSYYWPSGNTILGFTVSTIYYDSSNTEITRDSISNNSPLANTRARINFNFTPPINTVTININITFNGTITSTSQVLYFDSVQIVAANSVQVYFDGDTPGYRWTGVVGNSTSVLGSILDSVSRLKSPSRTEVIVYPHKAYITSYETLQVRKMLKRLAPVDSVITVPTQGFGINVPVVIDSVSADSSFFNVNKFVTGFVGSQLTAAQEPNPSYRWVQDLVEVQAPHLAFGESQEYSEYYIYSTDSKSSIDSVTYTSENNKGTKSPEKNYSTATETLSGWGPWINFDISDSPDNYPGGKYGKTPRYFPPLTLQGKPYVFTYKSQSDYQSKMKIQLNKLGATYNSVFHTFSGTPDYVVNGIGAWRDSWITSNAYRLPISSIGKVLNTWTPDEAIVNTTPTKTSTITSSWFSKTTG